MMYSDFSGDINALGVKAKSGILTENGDLILHPSVHVKYNVN